MAAEARAAAGSPRRAAMAKEARESGSAFTAQSGRRGSDGALLRSVRRKRATTVTTLSGLSVAGAAVATVMFATAGNGSEVTVDTSAGSEPRQINAESVNADIPAADENSSI
ncbi:hypothetical protein KCW65_20805, partial [Mycobacterium tuberculosis]|nr:hypothetical protein [Mycobacterium tuberculosis]